MKHPIAVALFGFLVFSLLVGGTAFAKSTQGRFANYKFVETPQEPVNAPEIGGSMYQAAAANTTVLGWWQFDTPGGIPTKEGWVEVDITASSQTYWHVAGTPVGCDAITPLAGTKSMWCGQWPTTSPPWCGWAALPGYGNSWDQSLESTVSNVTTVAYAIAWDAEPGYDFAYLEWYDAANIQWVADANANGGAGSYTGNGSRVENLASPYGSTRVRFHFVSDGAWSDEDGMWPTAQGAVKVDMLSTNGGAAEDWENEACNATQSTDGKWVTIVPNGFGNYAKLHSGATVVQIDPCVRVISSLWGFFDDPATTNYACGGWPLQGAVPYGPDDNGLYLNNEIWSPWIPIAGGGDEFILSFLTYRDLPLDALVFYTWNVRTRDNDAGGCPGPWTDFGFGYYGGGYDWIRSGFQIGIFIPGSADDLQLALGAVDMCGAWGGMYGSCSCHTHAPLFDQVKMVRVELSGPQYIVRDIDMWQDNFPELGGIGPTSYARCDQAQDVIPSNKKNLLPGDSLKIWVTDPAGLATDNTGGRPGKAAYVFVKCTDRFGADRSYTGAQMASPDNKAWAADPNAGLLRWPYVAGVAPEAQNWYAYRLDKAYTPTGGLVKDSYCADLMDLAAGPDGPPYHPNENWAANTGIFAPGDVIRYFVGARNATGGWSYFHRTMDGQGVGRRTNSIGEAMASPMEWSVLPDAGRAPGDAGDILFVDDADDRGGPAQIYFDFAFKSLGIEDRVDRYDVLGPSSVVGNSLAGRVKSIQNQMIGATDEIYQKVLWNSSDLSRGLMGDGGTPNGGSSPEKSDDFALCYTFLNTHPDNPGWAYWGDDVVQDWSQLIGLGAVNVKGTYMNHTLVGGDQKTITGVVSPMVYTVPPSGSNPWYYEQFYAYGGCPIINDFDIPGASGASLVGHRYNNTVPASLYQATGNSVGSTARFFLAGFGFDFIRDDDTDEVPDYATHLWKVLQWMQNVISAPTGVDPVVYSNHLENAYPNPFNPTTTIKYSIASAGRVSLKIYNAAGQLVRTLVDEEQAPQPEGFSAAWDGLSDHGQSVASGVYFYKLTTKEFSDTKKMVLLK